MSASDFERYEIEIDNPLYPIALKDMNEPPEKLYVIGNSQVFSLWKGSFKDCCK